jgi:hypothetical protein
VRETIKDLEMAKKFLALNSLSLPLVCKPEAISSHEVYLVPDLAALCELEPPCILQEFVKHDALLFKVYVIGLNDITVCRRRSVRNDVSLEEVHFGRISKQKWTPDLEAELTESSTAAHPYTDSAAIAGGGHQPTPRTPNPAGQTAAWPSVAESLREKVSDSLPDGYTMVELTELVQQLSTTERFGGLALFNFDLLFETDTNRPCIVDINALPINWGSIPGCHGRLFRFLAEQSLQQK